jgi:hypothetical protein
MLFSLFLLILSSLDSIHMCTEKYAIQLPIPSFYEWEDWDPNRVSHSHKVTELLSGRDMMESSCDYFPT